MADFSRETSERVFLGAGGVQIPLDVMRRTQQVARFQQKEGKIDPTATDSQSEGGMRQPGIMAEVERSAVKAREEEQRVQEIVEKMALLASERAETRPAVGSEQRKRSNEETIAGGVYNSHGVSMKLR